MPELPPPKRQPVIEPEISRFSSAGAIAYAELHCRTNFSFLEGASHPDELVQTAAQLGYRALAVTDRNSLAGVVRAHVAAKAAGLALLIGAEVTPADAPPVVLLASDRAAYGRLCRLLTRGRRNAPKGECLLTLDDVAEHAEGLLACVVLKHCWSSGFSLRRLKPELQLDILHRYRDIFADRCYALAELHYGPDDRLLLAQIFAGVRRPVDIAPEVETSRHRKKLLHVFEDIGVLRIEFVVPGIAIETQQVGILQGTGQNPGMGLGP